MRLDYYLGKVTELSRSLARKAIRDGRVLVDGELQTQPAMHVAETAEVQLDAEAVSQPGHYYFMMNKPKGYVCATEDRRHSTLLDLLNEPVTSGLHFVGRLDIDTTGLLLITDDGAWSHRITAPARKCPKDYLVELAEPLSEQAAERLRQGVILRSEKKPTAPAQLEYLTPRRVRLTLSEGRYHQVKRMLAAVGNRVTSLRRERIGGLRLDRSLAPGEYRPLSQLELEAVFTDSGESRDRLSRSIPLTSTNRV